LSEVAEHERDLARQLLAMAREHTIGDVVSIDTQGPEPFGIWLGVGDEDDDLIGTGETLSEAMADAIVTMRKWEAR
jgi:hypothetical protein